MSTASNEKLISSTGSKQNYVLVIHGGAGIISRQGTTPDQLAQYRNALRAALLAGHDVLRAGGEAMDATVAAVTMMEGLTVSLLTGPKYLASDYHRLPSIQCGQGCCIQR